MREDENLILKKKFRDWFGETVPPDVSIPAEIDHSIGDPVPADLPLKRKRRRRVNKSAKYLVVLFHGFRGAILFGLVAGFILYILSLSIWRWINYHPLIQFIVIFSAMVIGFYISLVKVLTSQKRER